MAIDGIAAIIEGPVPHDQMRDNLVTVEIKINPLRAASALSAAKQVAIKLPSRGKIMDWKGEMEGTE